MKYEKRTHTKIWRRPQSIRPPVPPELVADFPRLPIACGALHKCPNPLTQNNHSQTFQLRQLPPVTEGTLPFNGSKYSLAHWPNCGIRAIQATKCHSKYNRDVQQYRHNRDEVLRNWRVGAYRFFSWNAWRCARAAREHWREKARDLERG